MLHLLSGGQVHAPLDITKEIFIHGIQDKNIDKGRIRIRKHVVEWTRANGYVIDRTFRFDDSVLDVALVTFDGYNKKQSLCVPTLQDNRITVISPTGSVLDVHLPFHASALFPMQKGILIERRRTVTSTIIHNLSQTNNHKIRPIWFSLLHPLEEIKPVVCETLTSTPPLSSSMSASPSAAAPKNVVYVSDPLEKIIHVNLTPLFAVFYHQRKQTCRVKRIVRSPFGHHYLTTNYPPLRELPPQYDCARNRS
jgi:hypothetical protein